ncbi:MAG: exo-alpha-sialidase [Isosphaeraceae bacterium]
MLSTLTALIVFGLTVTDARNHQHAVEQSPIFVSGAGGYHTYRIPSLIVTRNGTLLAFCEGRKHSSSDSGDIDLLLRRSVDGGKTWGKTQVVWDDGPNTCGNPCPVFDATTNTIWLLLTHNLGTDTEGAIVNGTSKKTRTVWVTKSQDEGETWSPPAEITATTKRPEWTWYATGPGIGIQLRGGRLVVPCDNVVAGSKIQQSNVILSDDGGKTWRIGGVVGPHCDECQVVELADGRVMLNIRGYRGNHRRLVAISTDGGETFSAPVEDASLVEPVCQASILGISRTNDILFSNPASTQRERLTVRMSADGGKTWPHARVLHEGPSAYSCLAQLKDGTLACLYEQGRKNAYETITLARFSRDWLASQRMASRPRRILYNLDGDSCMFLKKGSKGPETITADDLKAAVHELTEPGSQVDTLLVCINAQVMYYPTKVGTLRGADCTPEERRGWPASEEQRFRNVQAMFDAGIDPYAVLLAEAKKRGLEALLTFRVNDAHGNDFLRTAFWREHPEYRLGHGALDFGHDAVRDYVCRLIEEAVQRYDCDGIELDFQRFPTYFKDGTTEERVAKINSLVARVRTLLDAQGAKRGRRLILAARVPSDYGRTPPSYETARSIGCDPVEWARQGWIDFLTVSEFLFVRYDLPIKPWKKLITNVPVYGGIECAEGGKREQSLTAAGYRKAARHLWTDGADGVYLFNFFTPREHGAEAFEPPFSALQEIGDPKTIDAADAAAAQQHGWRQKEFLITFWSPPPAVDKALAAVAAEHYNLTWVPEEGLDGVARHHLRAMLTSDLLNPATLEHPARRAQLDALINRVKNHPALEAYFLTDEPGAGAFPGLGKLVAYLRERDPVHLAYINLYPTYANERQLGVTADAAARERVGIPNNFAGVGTSNKTVLAYQHHLKKYLEIVKPDLISYDHYHFLKHSDGNQYFLNLGLIRKAALEAQKPFLNIIQASTVEQSWRLPNARELRFLVFTTLAYGGRGISYFLYWGPKSQGGLYQDGKPSPLARDAALLNAELARLGPILLTLESTGVYHTAPLPYGTTAVPPSAPVQFQGKGEFVLGLFGHAGKTTALLVVNRNYRQRATATLKIGMPGDRIQELDRRTGQWTEGEKLGSDRIVKVQLGPGDGRMFRLRD